MNDMFDRLQGEMEKRNRDSGISPMDLLDLPEHKRLLMRKMLRSRSMRKDEITAFVETWNEEKRLTQKQLDAALTDLSDQGWLIPIGEGDAKGFRVNLRRKKGSQLNNSIWGAIDSKLKKE